MSDRWYLHAKANINPPQYYWRPHTNTRLSLAGAPPYGSKLGAVCWQESDTVANAACTWDCVSVKLANGTEFYPVGCSFKIENGTGTPTSVSLPGIGPTSSVPSSTPSSFGHPGVVLPGVGSGLIGLVGAVAAIFGMI